MRLVSDSESSGLKIYLKNRQLWKWFYKTPRGWVMTNFMGHHAESDSWPLKLSLAHANWCSTSKSSQWYSKAIGYFLILHLELFFVALRDNFTKYLYISYWSGSVKPLNDLLKYKLNSLIVQHHAQKVCLYTWSDHALNWIFLLFVLLLAALFST